jgi:hypothetical protein
MRKLLVPLGVIVVALAVAAPASGAYRTSPKEGKSVVLKYYGIKWPLRNCWRIGPGGAGSYGYLPGGIVCRQSQETGHQATVRAVAFARLGEGAMQLDQRLRGLPAQDRASNLPQAHRACRM